MNTDHTTSVSWRIPRSLEHVTPIPVMSCPNCLRPYTAAQWLQLAALESGRDGMQSRTCAHCGTVMTVPDENVREHLHKVMPSDEYLSLFPHSRLPRTVGYVVNDRGQPVPDLYVRIAKLDRRAMVVVLALIVAALLGYGDEVIQWLQQ